MTAEHIYHNAVLIRVDDKIIWVDPYNLPEQYCRNNADAVLVTHSHYDHFSPQDIKKVLKADGVTVCPAAMQTDAGALGRTIAVRQNDAVDLGFCKIISFPAYNINKRFHPKGEGVGYIVQQEKRILIAGDTDCTPELCAQECDMAFLPIGGTYTMDAVEAAKAAQAINAAQTVPTHYASIDGIADKSAGDVFRSMLKKR